MDRTNDKQDGRGSRYEPRRQDLLAAAVEYVFEHGLSALSIRPLSAALGISHRTLLYHFGSKEELIVEILKEVRARERLLFAFRSYDQDTVSVLDFVQEAFQRFTSPTQGPYFRLFFEVYGLALQDRALYGSFLDGVISDWLPIITNMLIHDGYSPEDAPAVATLILGTTRGLQLDLLATGDRERVEAAFETFLITLRRLLQTA